MHWRLIIVKSKKNIGTGSKGLETHHRESAPTTPNIALGTLLTDEIQPSSRTVLGAG